MNTTIIFIPFPPNEEKIAEDFFSNKLGLENIDGEFRLPNCDQIMVGLKICKDILKINSSFQLPSLFTTPVKNNMLSICKSWIDKGVNIEYLHSDPGGYSAIIVDPFGNRMEFTCDNWGDEDGTIDPFEWNFFRKLD